MACAYLERRRYTSFSVGVCRPALILSANHAMERTADRRENPFSMIKISHSNANLALVSGRSSSSR